MARKIQETLIAQGTCLADEEAQGPGITPRPAEEEGPGVRPQPQNQAAALTAAPQGLDSTHPDVSYKCTWEEGMAA